MSPKSRALQVTAASLVVIFVSMSMTFAVLMTMWFFERSPLVYSGPFVILNKGRIHVGDLVYFTVERCSTEKEMRSYIVTRELVHLDTGDADALPSSSTDIHPGCHFDIGLPVLISVTTRPGLKVVRGRGYIEGQIKHFSVPWVTEPFMVYAKETP